MLQRAFGVKVTPLAISRAMNHMHRPSAERPAVYGCRTRQLAVTLVQLLKRMGARALRGADASLNEADAEAAFVELAFIDIEAVLESVLSSLFILAGERDAPMLKELQDFLDRYPDADDTQLADHAQELWNVRHDKVQQIGASVAEGASANFAAPIAEQHTAGANLNATNDFTPPPPQSYAAAVHRPQSGQQRQTARPQQPRRAGTCRWCSRAGHFEKECRQRLAGKPQTTAAHGQQRRTKPQPAAQSHGVPLHRPAHGATAGVHAFARPPPQHQQPPPPLPAVPQPLFAPQPLPPPQHLQQQHFPFPVLPPGASPEAQDAAVAHYLYNNVAASAPQHLANNAYQHDHAATFDGPPPPGAYHGPGNA